MESIFHLIFIDISVVLRHVCCKTMPGLEGFGTDPALYESNGKAEVIGFKVLSHVSRVESNLSTQVARPGALFTLTSVN